MKTITRILSLAALTTIFLAFPAKARENVPVRVAAPTGLGTYTEKPVAKVLDADIYVSPAGDDSNSGDISHPLRTIEKARSAVRKMDRNGRKGITVALMAGDYRVKPLRFTKEDGGTKECPVTWCAYGDGEVTLNGGVSVDLASFVPVKDRKVMSRLQKDVRKKVVCLPLDRLGITSEDCGKMFAIGAYNTAAKYSGETTGPLFCELFINDRRMPLARYPDTGWLYLEDNDCIVRDGVHCLSGPSISNPDWENTVDPESEVYRMPEDVVRRMAGWKTLDDVWVFNYFSNDWADASSPIKYFNASSREMQLKYTAFYGQKVSHSPYYFYNCLEELTSPGEWYLDRKSNVLYLLPPEDVEGISVDLSVTSEPIISIENADHLVFSGLTVKGTRGDAVSVKGSGNILRRCLIKCVGGNAIILSGNDNLLTENEITRTGRGGIIAEGGESETLRPGNNVVDNNLIHDWAEIYNTYQPAVKLQGVGNVCSHNEIYNTPHQAISFLGNNHRIEYNLIHDVCLLSHDAGAIYAWAGWVMYGNVIRYNCIYNVGGNGYEPNGIYMDDAMSGQTIYGNLLVNIPKRAIHLGGGRDLNVYGNIIVNTDDTAIQYDQRGYNHGWYTLTDQSNRTAIDMTKAMLAARRNKVWMEAFPQMKRIVEDFDATEDPGYVTNPACSKVTGNLIINRDGDIGSIDERVYRFSDVSGNVLYRMDMMKKVFVDPDNGNYSLIEDSPLFEDCPGFEPIPLGKIGRY
ncbi:MAG: right-handed parallel beta-helix repeat-containing protein [Bacteroidales bacterium]|nr:right-handed parallel beta-helix repeat-containing protein [Bacteroidales bacterium]